MRRDSVLQIIVKNNGRHRTYKVKDDLKEMGFQYGHNGKKYWYLEVPKEAVNEKKNTKNKKVLQKKAFKD